MPTRDLLSDPIARRGHELYDSRIRPQVEAGNKGKLLVINLDTGEYEMDADDFSALENAKGRFPDAPLFTMRIGYPAAYHLRSPRLVVRTKDARRVVAVATPNQVH